MGDTSVRLPITDLKITKLSYRIQRRNLSMVLLTRHQIYRAIFRSHVQVGFMKPRQISFLIIPPNLPSLNLFTTKAMLHSELTAQSGSREKYISGER